MIQFLLYETPIIGKLTESESRADLTRGGDGRPTGRYRLVARVSVRTDEGLGKHMVGAGGGQHNTVDVVNAAELYISKWQVLSP